MLHLLVPLVLGLGFLTLTSAVQIRSYNKVNYEDFTSKEQLEALFSDGVVSTNLVLYVIPNNEGSLTCYGFS